MYKNANENSGRAVWSDEGNSGSSYSAGVRLTALKLWLVIKFMFLRALHMRIIRSITGVLRSTHAALASCGQLLLNCLIFSEWWTLSLILIFFGDGFMPLRQRMQVDVPCLHHERISICYYRRVLLQKPTLS